MIKKIKPYVVYKGKKYVRGFGLMPYEGSNIKMANKYFKNVYGDEKVYENN